MGQDKRLKRETHDDISGNLQQEFRDLLTSHNAEMSIDELIESILNEIDGEDNSNNGLAHRLRHKSIFRRPISINLEAYILAEQARKRHDWPTNSQSAHNLLSVLSQSG